MSKERTLKIILEYDGTNFAGWQIQPDIRTVQQTVEEAFTKSLRHPLRLTAAGRTDAGVHAQCQVVSLKTPHDIETGRLKRALNGILPRDITILDIADTYPDFNARYDARSRKYRYTLSDRRISIGRNYVWHVKYNISRELLEQATRLLNGHHNLRGFSKGKDEDDYSTIIFKNLWKFQENLIIFEIEAVRFFHHSVRSIIGSAIEVARGKESHDLISRILESRDRSLASPTAPAKRLCLVGVNYGE